MNEAKTRKPARPSVWGLQQQVKLWKLAHDTAVGQCVTILEQVQKTCKRELSGDFLDVANMTIDEAKRRIESMGDD